MDFKIMRQPFAVNETVYSGKAEIPIDEDFVMPDYCAEINKMLKCKVEGRITSKSINGQNINIDGHFCINILYLDKSCVMHRYEHISPFSKSIDTSLDINGAFIEATLKNEYSNCRVVTERKVSVHGALSLLLKAILQKKIDVIADVSGEGIQLNRKDMPALNSIGNAEKNLLIEEELVLSNGQPSIDEILRYSANPTVTEVKALKNKAAVKGNLAVTVLYSSNKQCCIYKCSVPFSQLLEINDINEDCICTAKVQLSYLEVALKTGNNDRKCMTLNAKLNIMAESYCNGEIPVIIDAYSTNYNLQLKNTDISIEKVLGHISDTFMFKNTLEFKEGKINSIIDSWCDTNIISCSYNEKTVTVKANVNICILSSDGDGVSFLEKKAELVYTKTTDYDCNGQLKCEPQFEPISVSYTIVNDNCIEYRIEYRVNLSLREENAVSLLFDIENEGNDKKEKHQDGSLVVYFANSGEKVWDIAKKYNTDLNQMCEINSLFSDYVEKDQRLLIPLF